MSESEFIHLLILYVMTENIMTLTLLQNVRPAETLFDL
jgi:hypothetical protein